MYGALTSAVQSFGGVGEAWKAYKSYQEGSPVQPPKVSTGTSMVPYTGGGAVAPVGGEVQQMGPFESMMIILEDIRDGTYGIIDKLQDMMDFGIPTFSLGPKAAQQAARQTGRSETEDGKQKGIIPTITGAFTGLMPEGGFGDKLKLLAFTGLLWALSKYQDIIIPKLAFVLKKLKKIALWFTKEGEGGEIEVDWTKVLLVGAGAMAIKILAGLVFSPLGMGMAFTGFAKLAPHLVKGARLLGPLGIAAAGIYSAYQIMGDAVAAQDWTEEKGATDTNWANMIGGALGGKIEGGLMNAFAQAGKFAIPFGIAGAAIGSIVPVLGTGIGFIVGAVIGTIFGLIMGFIGGGKIAKFFESMGEWISEKWNNMVQGFKDIFFDREVTTMVGGKEMKHTQRSKVGAMADSMRELEKSINEWMDNAFEKMFGWIPTKAEMKETWTDMTTKIDDWKKDMTTWFSDMWDKLTGWIPSVADIKAAGGDMLQWTKDIIKDIKLWFWDTSKPQIIGIDLSKISDAFPSIESIKEGILSTLPDWMRPKTIEQQIDELEDKIERSEAGENVFFGRETKGRKKAKEKIAELRALLLEEAEESSIDGVSNRANFEVANMRKVAGASGQALAEVTAVQSKGSAVPGGAGTIIDAKRINNMQQTTNTSVDAGAQDRDGIVIKSLKEMHGTGLLPDLIGAD
jgi:hypothetical protein